MSFIRWSSVVGFSMATLYHLTCTFLPKVGDVAAGRWHLLYFVIYFVALVLMAANHARSLLILIPLVIQQFFVQGVFLWQEWDSHQKIEWINVSVLVAMPILGMYIYKVNKDLFKRNELKA